MQQQWSIMSIVKEEYGFTDYHELIYVNRVPICSDFLEDFLVF